MIGQMFNCYPNFNQLLATYRRNSTKDKYTLCIDMFPTLIEYFQKKVILRMNYLKTWVF